LDIAIIIWVEERFWPFTACSETVCPFDHVQIQAWIGVIENEGGHVLEAVPDGKMPGDIQIDTDM
jgi:hypothetical protein